MTRTYAQMHAASSPSASHATRKHARNPPLRFSTPTLTLPSNTSIHPLVSHPIAMALELPHMPQRDAQARTELTRLSGLSFHPQAMLPAHTQLVARMYIVLHLSLYLFYIVN